MADNQAVCFEEGFRVMGRKNKYFTNIKPNIDLIVGYLSSGHTESSVAKRFGVGVSTWERHKYKYEEFREAIHKSGMNAVALVVKSIFKRANGYTYKEEHAEERIVDGIKTTVSKVVKKHVPPDTAAGIYITTNRDPEHWKNTQNIKHSGVLKNTGVLAVPIALNEETWEKLAKAQQSGNEQNGNEQNGKH